jgi:cellulose synthase/poly-beta-1,6-N-acetylglucosamine synthase-like glycosyltransferase
MLTWTLKDLFSFTISTPIGLLAFGLGLMFFDYFFLLPRHFLQRALKGPPEARPHDALPSGLLVIPSLLRAADELDAIKATVSNVVENAYPGEMLVVVSIDGFAEAPKLYEELVTWISAKKTTTAAQVWLYVTGTAKRRGKPLAIEHGVGFVKRLVAAGEHAEFPKIYFSTDADADLGPNALEHLARRLCMKNPITGSPERAVAGNLYVRGNAYWQGWRKFFSVEGQLSIQVAREYLVTNVARHNKRPFPLSGITGVLYCMWTDIFLEAPRFMGFMRTLTWTDWAKWWIGFAPPKYSESDAKPIPELLAGDTDDTVSAFLAVLSRWENGRFTLDAPRTPLHAFYYMARSFLFDRALRYEPEARVYTSSPTALKTLWKQRVRWNTARIEVAGRFGPSFLYHWDIGACAIGVVALMLKYVFFGLFYYVQVPMAVFHGSLAARIGGSFVMQLGVYAIWTFCALVMNGEVRKNGRLMMALPLAPAYTFVFSFWTTFTGVINDVFLFGNVTKFAPETTLIRGGSKRVALLARVRRVAVLTLRSVVWGDVPFGAFWFGWGETPYTPSGFHGWTQGRRPSLLERLRYGTVTFPRHASALPATSAEHVLAVAEAPATPRLAVIGAVVPANDNGREDAAPPSRRAA